MYAETKPIIEAPTAPAVVEKRLPDKMSDLLEVALKDLRRAERHPLFTVDMGVWIQPRAVRCAVCLAGAALKFELDIKSIDQVISGNDAGRKALALNSLRTGSVSHAARFMGLDSKGYEPFDRSVSLYGVHRREFHRDLRQLVTDLRAAGK